MTATKAQLVEFILDNFEGPDHIPASRAKLESYKKSELEEFVKAMSSEEEVAEWLNK